jgi:hypothetical protein
MKALARRRRNAIVAVGLGSRELREGAVFIIRTCLLRDCSITCSDVFKLRRDRFVWMDLDWLHGVLGEVSVYVVLLALRYVHMYILTCLIEGGV